MSSNTSKLQYPNNKQFLLTVPQALVKAKGWQKGDQIEFTLTEKGSLVLKKRGGKRGQ